MTRLHPATVNNRTYEGANFDLSGLIMMQINFASLLNKGKTASKY